MILFDLCFDDSFDLCYDNSFDLGYDDNFDLGYEELTDMSTAKANSYSKSFFWDLFREKLDEKGVKERDFWANLPWQPGGQKLCETISPYMPNILSAPAIDFSLPFDEQLSPEKNQAIQGKKEWIAKNLSGVGEEIFVPAPQKALYANPKSIIPNNNWNIELPFILIFAYNNNLSLYLYIYINMHLDLHHINIPL
jgi:hypothetical protein